MIWPRKVTIFSLLLGFVLLSSATLAGEARQIEIRDDTTLGGRWLPAGTYTLSWIEVERDGLVEVRILRGKKVVARTKARLETRDAAGRQAVVYRANPDEGYELVEFRPEGRARVLRLQPQIEATLASTPATSR